MTRQRRKVAFTFIAAGVGAIIVEHMLKPKLKRGFRL